MNKKDVVQAILNGRKRSDINDFATAIAHPNIALIKYWGKRDENLFLPYNSSLSVSLDQFKTETKLSIVDEDEVIFNGVKLDINNKKAQRIIDFLDLIRPSNIKLRVETVNDFPTSAGFASSASGFAALTKAVNALFNLNLSNKDLSILARLGSVSAARSIESGFVSLVKGVRDDGMDCYAQTIESDMNISIKTIEISGNEKLIDSRDGMKITVDTSPLYKFWPQIAEEHYNVALHAIKNNDFKTLGEIAELNCLLMHSSAMMSSPVVDYLLPQTREVMQKVQMERRNGIEAYFTIDAGPNVKVITKK